MSYQLELCVVSFCNKLLFIIVARRVVCKEANDFKKPEEHLPCRGQEIKWAEFGRLQLPDNST